MSGETRTKGAPADATNTHAPARAARRWGLYDPKSAHLGAPRAILLGWLLVGFVAVLYASVRVALPRAGIGLRLSAHAFDLGQVLAAGLASAAAAGLWLRFGPRAAGWGYLALYAVAGAVGLAVLREDLQGIAGDPRGAKSIALSLAASACIPAAAFVARALGRGKLRLVLATGAFAAALVNNALLARSYPGIHLFALWGASTLAAGALAGQRLPRALAWLGRTRGAGVYAGEALLCVAASYAAVVHPSSLVLGELSKIPGAALAPFLARIGPKRQVPPRVTEDGAAKGPWFEDRSALAPAPPTGPPLLGKNAVVLLLSVDALRADLVASERYAAALPVMHRLAAEGLSFTKAYSPASATFPSLAGIFTGRFFSQLYWTEQSGGGNQKLFPTDDPTPRLQSLLREGGVHTALVMSGTGLADKYGVTNDFGEAIGTGLATGRPAASLTSDIVARLRKLGADEGLLVYTHYFEPHSPYDRGGKEGTPFERYLREVAIVDRELDKIVAVIAELGIGARTLLIVTGDHGESFGEPYDFHGTTDHSLTIYDELVHVPLVMWGGAVNAAARAVDTPVSLVDLGPTLLDLYGLDTPASFMGESLVPFLRGEDPALARPVVVESGRWQRGMYFADGLKLVIDAKRNMTELFDLAADPFERDNLYETRPDAEERRAELERYFEAHAYRKPGYSMPFRP